MRFGGRFPFFLENPFVQTYQRTPQFHFDETLTRANKLAQSQIQILMQSPPSKTQPLFEKSQGTGTDQMLETFAPSLSPDGSLLAFVARDSSRRSSLKIYKRNPTTGNFVGAKPWSSFSERESHAQEQVSPIPTPGPRFSARAFFNFSEFLEMFQYKGFHGTPAAALSFLIPLAEPNPYHSGLISGFMI
jgi:hypothetical protein